MRYSSDHKAQSRGRILQVAAAEMRTHGAKRVSISEIMSGAGLTNGAFYAHFKSKDDLIAEAITFMFEERYADMMAKVDLLDPKQALIDYFDCYLSIQHCEATEVGCPIPALAAEVPHMSKKARRRFSEAVSRVIEGLATLLDRAGSPSPRVQANSVLAELAGALSLARTAEHPAGAKAALSASRRALKQRLGLITPV